MKTSGRTLELSNSIWGNGFNEDYKKTLSQWLNADANPLPENTSTIDEWVKEKTHGKITALFGDKPTSSLDLYLINTVYFKDRWRDEFEKEKTKDGIFHNLNSGDTIVPMMHATENYACMETDFFYSIKLPYRNGGTMYIFLPKETVDFKDFINNFEISHFIDKKYTWQKVHLQLPKFKLEDKTDLKKIFQSLGINEIFNNENQDFTKMTSMGAYVKEMLQKTIIEVDEEGTTAAAATEGMVVAQGIEEISDFIIDRPFLFFVDKGNFMGIITKFEKVDSIDYTQFNTNRVTNLNGTSKRRRRR